jgi:UDP-glucose 4-epimerase
LCAGHLLMNILLTGGTGYIASHTAVVLIQAGHNIVLFDNLCNSRREVVNRLEKITQKNISFIEGDIRDTSLLSKSIQNHHIDAVIHFAGLKALEESVQKPLDYFSNNLGGTLSLLEAMRINGLKFIVFSSSATVYGEPQYLPIDELHPTNANNPYGKSKLYIEKILEDLAFSDKFWRIACLRYFNPVGAHDSGLIGEDPNGIPNNLMPFVSAVAAGKYPFVKVFGGDYLTPDGTGVRDYIHVMDLAEGHLAAINYLASDNLGWHAINLGTGQGRSVLEIINQFSLSSGVSIPYKIQARRDGDVSSCYASSTKALELLNWKAKRNLASICRSAWHWQENNQ